jgi:hypothetical protein
MFILYYHPKMRMEYPRALWYKLCAMLKMTLGIWDAQLIYDTQAHIYKSKFYVSSEGGEDDQLSDLIMIGTSHSLFWMFFPYQPFAVLTKVGEASNTSPTYVADTPAVKAQKAFLGTGEGQTLAQFLGALWYDWNPAKADKTEQSFMATIMDEPEGEESAEAETTNDGAEETGESKGDNDTAGADVEAGAESAVGAASTVGAEEPDERLSRELNDWLSDGQKLLEGSVEIKGFSINEWAGRAFNNPKDDGFLPQHYDQMLKLDDQAPESVGNTKRLKALAAKHATAARELISSDDPTKHTILWALQTKVPDLALLKHGDKKLAAAAQRHIQIAKNNIDVMPKAKLDIVLQTVRDVHKCVLLTAEDHRKAALLVGKASHAKLNCHPSHNS